MGEVHLDTDILIELIEKYNLDTIEDIMATYDLKISSIVYYEFCIGAYRTNKLYLKDIIDRYIDVVPFTKEIAEKTAQIQAKLLMEGTAIDHRDIIIGTTAISSGAKLRTKNLKHFQKLTNHGLKLFRPIKY